MEICSWGHSTTCLKKGAAANPSAPSSVLASGQASQANIEWAGQSERDAQLVCGLFFLFVWRMFELTKSPLTAERTCETCVGVALYAIIFSAAFARIFCFIQTLRDVFLQEAAWKSRGAQAQHIAMQQEPRNAETLVNISGATLMDQTEAVQVPDAGSSVASPWARKLRPQTDVDESNMTKSDICWYRGWGEELKLQWCFIHSNGAISAKEFPTPGSSSKKDDNRGMKPVCLLVILASRIFDSSLPDCLIEPYWAISATTHVQHNHDLRKLLPPKSCRKIKHWLISVWYIHQPILSAPS